MMTIKISGENSRGKRELLNDSPLAEYKPDEVKSMVDSAVSVSIFLKDETRASEARQLIESNFSHFKGDIISKSTKVGGWFVGQDLNPTRDDSSALRTATAQ